MCRNSERFVNTVFFVNTVLFILFYLSIKWSLLPKDRGEKMPLLQKFRRCGLSSIPKEDRLPSFGETSFDIIESQTRSWCQMNVLSVESCSDLDVRRYHRALQAWRLLTHGANPREHCTCVKLFRGNSDIEHHRSHAKIGAQLRHCLANPPPRSSLASL